MGRQCQEELVAAEHKNGGEVSTLLEGLGDQVQKRSGPMTAIGPLRNNNNNNNNNNKTLTPGRDPLLFISLSGTLCPRDVVRPRRLSERKISIIPLFLLPVLSDIPKNITLSSACNQI
jgi:hypothetical protein